MASLSAAESMIHWQFRVLVPALVVAVARNTTVNLDKAKECEASDTRGTLARCEPAQPLGASSLARSWRIEPAVAGCSESPLETLKPIGSIS